MEYIADEYDEWFSLTYHIRTLICNGHVPNQAYGWYMATAYNNNYITYWGILPFLFPIESIIARCKSLLETLFPTIQEECNASYHRELHLVVKLEMDNSNLNNITPSIMEIDRCQTTISLLYLCFVIRW